MRIWISKYVVYLDTDNKIGFLPDMGWYPLSGDAFKKSFGFYIFRYQVVQNNIIEWHLGLACVFMVKAHFTFFFSFFFFLSGIYSRFLINK